jgi:tripartite-type tricarboxylate transporter receptor subunit TctC
MQDVVGGHIDMMFTSPSIALAPFEAGSIKAYAVLAKERLKAAPDIPMETKQDCPGSTPQVGMHFGRPRVRCAK